MSSHIIPQTLQKKLTPTVNCGENTSHSLVLSADIHCVQYSARELPSLAFHAVSSSSRARPSSKQGDVLHSLGFETKPYQTLQLLPTVQHLCWLPDIVYPVLGLLHLASFQQTVLF